MPGSCLDLFAGAGGLSLGAKWAGLESSVAIEIDAWASETYRENHPETKLWEASLSEISDSDLKGLSGIDIVMGGPPCQGFSISASNRRDPNDPRNALYREFLRAIKAVRPRAVLIENVPEIRRFRNENGQLILDEIVEELSMLGYSSVHALLNAADFGVPQNRLRFFLLARREKSPPRFTNNSHFEHPTLIETPYLTLWDAISDLPEVKPRELSEDAVLPYQKEPENEYQRLLREGCLNVSNHIPMRHTKSTVEKFSRIGFKDDLSKKIAGTQQRKNRGKASTTVYHQNHRRLSPNNPSKTITASFYSSFIHPYQHRNLTLREAARIQSFPDSFVFRGKRTRLSLKILERKGLHEDLHLDQFNQVGNAVPPRLAQRLIEGLIENGN